ncbi:MAG: FAD-dependent thymidylate synthase [Candidatus Aenigmarchaeota archaeon]|nr:FAD-dependent thymidylate synthase [Candidatus Aenigmarchaeota archaeon]
MEQFTQEEVEILKPFFTNMDKSVFVLKNLPEVIKGALFARYSRSPKSLRKLLLDEFIRDKKLGFREIVNYQVTQGTDQETAIQKAEEFYDRILIQFGHSSVAELGGAHIAVEDVSILGTKFIEESRIGLSPLEKSTRYVWFDEKVDGKYKYYRDIKLMNSKFGEDYVEACDFLFDTYSKLIKPIQKFVQERFPQEESVSDRAYQSTIRAKSCDILRSLLPTSALTNMGVFGNGRAFDYLLTKMNAIPMSEARELSQGMFTELNKVIPSFVKVSAMEYGEEHTQYFSSTQNEIEKLTEQLLKNKKSDSAQEVELVYYEQDAVDKLVTSILYSNSKLPYKQIMKLVKDMSTQEKQKVLKTYVKKRTIRHHRPGRAFEDVYYKFDVLSSFGVYKDLMRHRILTRHKQLFTFDHGIIKPQEIIDSGFEEEFDQAIKLAKNTFEKISKKYPLEAQYLVPHCGKTRFSMTMNLREVFHFVELRSGREGHPNYRRVSQKMFKEIEKVQPDLAKLINFVDMSDYGLERLESEKRIDKRIEEVEKKYGGS